MDNLLLSISDALKFLTTSVVSPYYFPYSWGPTLHAARVSLVYQSLSRKSRPFPWGPYLAGYLISCWAGGAITHVLLGLPPPMLYSFQPYLNYLGVHLALTGFFSLFPSLLVPKIFDTVLFPIDALLRAISVTGALALLDNPNLSPAFRSMNNPFGHLLLGAVASASGGISLSTFSLSLPEWQFSTPPILTAGLWSSADVWGGALAAFLFGVATHNPAFSLPSLDPAVLGNTYYPLNLIPQGVLRLFFQSTPLSFLGKPRFHFLVALPVPIVHGKALAALALTVVFGSRVFYNHWLPPPTAQQPIPSKKLSKLAKSR